MISRANRSIISQWWWTIDKWLLVAAILLLAIGIVLSCAASPAVALHIGRLDSYAFVKQHILYAILALFVMVLISILNPRQLLKSYLFLEVISFIMLVLVLYFGYQTKGSVRWFHVFGLNFQPSELLKPTFIIGNAWLLSSKTRAKIKHVFAVSFVIYGLALILLINEPDIGQSILLTTIWCAMLFLADVNMKLISALFGVFIGMFYVIYLYSYHVHMRVEKFLTGIGDTFQVDMGREAILHGGWFGTGPGEGTIKRVIPDCHTDFVFSVAAEEYGIVSCLLIILIFAVLVLRAVYFARNERDNFMQLAIMGLALQIGMQSFINIGVNLHLLPAKGMTLPFISYGGSSMISIAMSIGALLCLTRKKPSIPI